MKKSNLIPKQKYIRRRTVDGKKTESIMECIQITPAGGFSSAVGIWRSLRIRR